MATKKQTANPSAGKGGTDKGTEKDADKAADEVSEKDADKAAEKADAKGSAKGSGKSGPAKSSPKGKGSAKSTGKGSGRGSGKSAFDKDAKAGGPSRKGRAVKVKQPKPWALIWTFSGVAVVALGLIAAAVFVVYDRSLPPDGVTSYYGKYANYTEMSEALSSGEITEDDLKYPWVAKQNHVDSAEDWDGTNPTYDISPPAGGNHLSEWQTCNGSVYDAAIVDGNAVHSLEHGAVWLTYDPALVDGDGIDQLSELITSRDYSFMSPYSDQGAAVVVTAWGVQYKTDDINDPVIEEFLDYYIQNADNSAESNASCSDGVTTTVEDSESSY